jgi:uncharacterized membrane protein YfcA
MHWLALTDLVATLALGAALGFAGGLFGIGGGIIAIPVLSLAFGMTQAMAQGTSLAMMVPVLLLGWWRYNRRHAVRWQPALQIGAIASATTWLVAHVATQLEPNILRAVFGSFLLLLALQMLLCKPSTAPVEGSSKLNIRLMPLVGILGGASMGLLGIGGGLIATPILTGIFGQRQTSAQSLSLALVTPCSIIALATYGAAGSVEWSMGLPMAIGGLLTVSSGVALAHCLPERKMRFAFAWMILITSIWLLLRSIVMK